VPLVLLIAAITKGSLPLIGLTLALVAFVAWLGYRDRALDRRLARSEDLGGGLKDERDGP
jgi:hypothetical protein